MKTPALAGLLMMVVCGLSVATAAEPGMQPSTLRLRLTDEVIKQAVRETLAEQPSTRADHGRVLGAERSTSFDKQMEEARTPSCLHPDALKHQPAQIGPIDLGGLLALPFLAAAVVRGKCNL